MKRVTDVHEIKYVLSEKGTTCYLCGEANLHYSGVILENVDPIYPESVEVFCRECSARRRKAPILAYVAKRFSKIATEYAHLSVILGKHKALAGADMVAISPKLGGNFRDSYAEETAKVGALVDDWDAGGDVSPPTNAPAELSDTALAKLDQTDPRLDPESSMFDEALYDRWLTL